MIKTTGPQLAVPSIVKVHGGLVAASLHTSMLLITIVLLLVMVKALVGITGKVIIIPSSSQR